MRTHRSFVAVLALAGALAAGVAAQDLTVPNKPKDTLKFAVIGDSGTGDSNQYRRGKGVHRPASAFSVRVRPDAGRQHVRRRERARFPAEVRDSVQAGARRRTSSSTRRSAITTAPNQRMYKLFNMNGERFYTFRPKAGVRFFALDSNYMDRTQLQWLEKELAASGSDWKIMYFHHPIYSSGGRHGSDTALRDQLEPLFLKYGVDVVLAGHEHFYERLKPQKGIHYFISGGAGKLRRGDVGGEYTEKAFDEGYHFMIFEIDGRPDALSGDHRPAERPSIRESSRGGRSTTRRLRLCRRPLPSNPCLRRTSRQRRAQRQLLRPRNPQRLRPPPQNRRRLRRPSRQQSHRHLLPADGATPRHSCTSSRERTRSYDPRPFLKFLTR